MGLNRMRKNSTRVPKGRLKIAQDVVLGTGNQMIQSRQGRLKHCAAANHGLRRPAGDETGGVDEDVGPKDFVSEHDFSRAIND